jgi:hypothetical protein
MIREQGNMSDQGDPLPRVDLAIEQLDVALELFLSDRSDVSALTLAGAAEEILGRALALQGKLAAIDEGYGQVDEFFGAARAAADVT